MSIYRKMDKEVVVQDIQAGFRKGRGTRDQIANIHWILEKARECQKKKTTSAKAFDCWTWNNGLVQNWERSTSRLYIITLLI